MAAVAVSCGKTFMYSAVDLKLNFDGIGPGALVLEENIVTFTNQAWHLVQGIPTHGPAPVGP